MFFRANLRDEAVRLRLAGWVRNLPDGRVEAEVQGAAEPIERFLRFCRSGPGRAVVESLEVSPRAPTKGASVFTIRAAPTA